MFYYYLFFVSIFGLCIGSFLNVVILRAFWGESIILPPSKCPNCKEVLKWHDNIPFFSYVILGGKCRNCKEEISIQYPIVELICSFFFVLMFIKFGLTLDFIFACIIVSFFIVIAVCDIKEKVIFTHHTYGLALVGIIYNIINNNILNSIIGLIIGFLIFEIISLVSLKILSKRAFGQGDSYVAGALGAIFGIKYIFPLVLISCIVQATFTLPHFIKSLYLRKDYNLLISLAFLIFFGIIFSIYENIVTFIIFILLAFFSIVKLMKNVKNEEEPINYPFAPALIIGAIIFIFFK